MFSSFQKRKNSDDDYAGTSASKRISTDKNDTNRPVYYIDDDHSTFKNNIDEKFRQLKEIFIDAPDMELIRLVNKYINSPNLIELATEELTSFNDLSISDENDNDNEDIQLLNDTISNKSINNSIIVIDNAQVNKKENNFNDDSIQFLSLEDKNFILNIFPNIRIDKVDGLIQHFYKFIDIERNIDKERRQALLFEFIYSKINSATNEDLINPSTSSFAQNIKNDKENKEKSYQEDVNEIKLIIKDCDPTHIEELLNTHIDKADRVRIIIDHLLEKPYPKLKDYLAKINRRKKIESNLEFNMDEFIRIYPNPVEYFYNIPNDIINDNYKEHCLVFLRNKFKLISSDSIEFHFKANNYRLTPTYHQFEEALRKSADLENRIVEHLAKFSLTYGQLENSDPMINVVRHLSKSNLFFIKFKINF
jgi:hypothetical protein